MAIKVKIEQEDLILYEIIKNPMLFGEFIYNLDLMSHEEPFEFDDYQKEMICDFNSYESLCCARSVGKTTVLSGLILWVMINDIYPGDYISYHVPGKNHVEPVFTRLVRTLRTNSFLKHYIDPKAGVNHSDFIIRLINNTTLMCRIAGLSGTGVSVIGLHNPFTIVDECIVGTQKILGKNSEKHISNLKSGDVVLSWNGEFIEEDRISSVKKTKRNQKILEIGFDSGNIRVGENHRIYTKNGYIIASKLSPGDSIYNFKGTKRKYFTEDEILIIKERIKNSVPIYEIAKELGRTESSIFRKINKLGLSIKEIFDSEKLSDIEYQIILGSLLGDGSAQFEITRARYSTNHSLKQKEYVDWLYNNLHRLIRTKPRIYKNGGWGAFNYAFETLGHKDILEIAKELYINNKKTITREYLNKLSPLGLAVWYMDDGSESGMFSTHSFSKHENSIIAEYLLDVWGVASNILEDKRKNLFFLKIKGDSLKKFREIVSSFIPQCMRYKIGEGKYNNIIPEISIISNGEKLESLNEIKISYIKEINTRSKYIYNIEVEKNHNFFVNGILTKNSGYYPWGTWVEFQPTINTFVSGFKLIVSGVPTGLRERNVLYHTDMENSSYSKHRISALQNKRFSEEDRLRAVELYGGEDSDDYIHLVLGKHGKPIYTLFDRTMMEIGNYPVFKMTLDGLALHDNLVEYVNRLSLFPGLPDRNSVCIIGIDLGYTDPTAIVILYEDKNGRLKFHGRIRLDKVNYFIQEKIIDWLDTKFNPIIIGIDEGSAGKAVVPRLQEHNDFSHKNFKEKIIPINFSSSIVLGTDASGNEIKSKTKPFSVGVLQEYANNHKLVFTSTDLEFITELERMTYSRTPTGDIVYRTLTERGGKKGEDHFTSSLLCASLAYYLYREKLELKSAKKKLAGSQWFLGG